MTIVYSSWQHISVQGQVSNATTAEQNRAILNDPAFSELGAIAVAVWNETSRARVAAELYYYDGANYWLVGSIPATGTVQFDLSGPFGDPFTQFRVYPTAALPAGERIRVHGRYAYLASDQTNDVGVILDGVDPGALPIEVTGTLVIDPTKQVWVRF